MKKQKPKPGAQLYRNSYVCPYDGTEWDDVWSCMCNDKCPVCNKEIEPTDSVELEEMQ